MGIEELLRRQAGVLCLAQARGLGMSERTVRRRLAGGQWTILLPGVYLAAGHRRTDEVRLRAASLWGGEHALVSGPGAAFWHGYLVSLPRPVGLTVPARCRRRGPRGVRVRRRDIAPPDRATVRGVPLTGPALTVLETAAVLPDGAAFLDRALQRHVGFPELHAAYCRSSGAHGMGRAGELLVSAGDRADSIAERRLAGLLRRAGMGEVVLGHPFGDYTIDLAFPAAMIAIEVDSWAWHSDVERFRTDRRKGNALVAAGWTLLRFTWQDIVDRPEATVAQIRAALQRARRMIEDSGPPAPDVR